MFLFEGMRILYRKVLKDSRIWIETFADMLPKGSEVTARTVTTGVDRDDFCRYTLRFFGDICGLTQNSRKLLLLYDGYRSHMNIGALEILRVGGVIAYALPAHTTGVTRPPDLACFASWKQAYAEMITALRTVAAYKCFDVFRFAKFLNEAYKRTFTASNAIERFRKAGLYSLHEKQLTGVPRLASADIIETVMTLNKCFSSCNKSAVSCHKT